VAEALAEEDTSGWVTGWDLVEVGEGAGLDGVPRMLGVGPGTVCPIAILMGDTDLVTHTTAMA